MITCPHCGHPLPTVANLAARAEAMGFEISIDGYLDSAATAVLLNRNRATLRQWRYQGIGPPWRRNGRCCEYAVTDLADWLATEKT
jgi:hypothetical protein